MAKNWKSAQEVLVMLPPLAGSGELNKGPWYKCATATEADSIPFGRTQMNIF